jgi:NAD kinase
VSFGFANLTKRKSAGSPNGSPEVSSSAPSGKKGPGSVGGRNIVLVTRRTRLQESIARHNTVEQARFHIEHLGLDFSDFILEDSTYQHALQFTQQLLQGYGRLQVIERGFLPNYVVPNDALIVTLGQDGLVANSLKYVPGKPVLALNPDPERWDGKLMPFKVSDLSALMPEVIADRRTHRSVVMARARLNDGQQLLAVNDLFVGTRTHVSARYQIQFNDLREVHSSSGIVISTGLGSTGWMRSILTAAMSVTESPSKRLQALRDRGFAWDEERLIFSVREPFPSKITQTQCIFGEIQQKSRESGTAEKPSESVTAAMSRGSGTAEMSVLKVRSLMSDNGVIFSDGMEADGLVFSSGLEATIDVAPERGCLLL